MHNPNMLIHLTGRYDLFCRAFISFPSTPQWVLSICSFYLLVDLYSFSQNSHIFTPHHYVYFWCAHSTRQQIFHLSHRNHTFSLTSQCILLICSFKLPADMYSFPQKLQFYSTSHVYFWYGHSNYRQICSTHSFPQKFFLPLQKQSFETSCRMPTFGCLLVCCFCCLKSRHKIHLKSKTRNQPHWCYWFCCFCHYEIRNASLVKIHVKLQHVVVFSCVVFVVRKVDLRVT